jgi:hypothetical protein
MSKVPETRSRTESQWYAVYEENARDLGYHPRASCWPSFERAHRVYERWRRLVRPELGDSYLDIGSGVGLNYDWLKKSGLLNDDEKYVGLEPVEDAVRVCRSEHPDAHIVQDQFPSPEIEGVVCDHAVAMGTLLQVADPGDIMDIIAAAVPHVRKTIAFTLMDRSVYDGSYPDQDPAEIAALVNSERFASLGERILLTGVDHEILVVLRK